jgi:hypothetical protein
MRFLLLVTLIAVVAAVWPAIRMQRGWLYRLGQRIRLVAAIYVFVILVSAILRITLNWNDIY